MKNFTVIILVSLFNLIIWAQQCFAYEKPEKISIKNVLSEDFKLPIPAVSGYGYALDA